MIIICSYCQYDTVPGRNAADCIKEVERAGGYYNEEADNKCPQCAEPRLELMEH